MTPTPKYRPGQVVVLNRGVPKRPGGKGKPVWLEAGHQFAVVRCRDAGGGYVDYDLRDGDGTIWEGVPEVALDPAEGAEGPEADRGGEGPPAGTERGSLFD